MKYYFLSMTPEEEGVTYNGENNTVEYTLYLKELVSHDNSINNGLFEWLRRLLASKSEPEFEQFVQTSLGVPALSSACGIWGLFSDLDDNFALPLEVSSLEEAVKLCDERISVERSKYCSNDIMRFSSTMEFDNEFSFFATDIFKLSPEEWKEKLGPHLSKFIQYNEDDDSVTLPQSKVVYTAYL